MKIHRYTQIAVLAAFINATVSYGAVSATLEEVGSNVVLSYSGSINLTGLTFDRPGNIGFGSGAVSPSNGSFSGNSVNMYFYNGFSGPTSFGTGSGASDGIATGDRFRLDAIGIPVAGIDPFIAVSEAYVSGEFLSGGATFADTTIAELGATPGVYAWTWGAGVDADSVTLTVVPESSTYALILGLMAIGVLAVRRRNTAGNGTKF